MTVKRKRVKPTLTCKNEPAYTYNQPREVEIRSKDETEP